MGIDNVADHVVLSGKRATTKRTRIRLLPRMCPHMMLQVRGHLRHVTANAAEFLDRPRILDEPSSPDVCARAPLSHRLGGRKSRKNTNIVGSELVILHNNWFSIHATKNLERYVTGVSWKRISFEYLFIPIHTILLTVFTTGELHIEKKKRSLRVTELIKSQLHDDWGSPT